MKCFLDISNFLEEISSLSHSIVFPYFFALIAEEGFLISPCYSLELSCYFDDPKMLAIWSLGPLSFLNPDWTSGSSWFMYCWSLPWGILSITLVVCEWVQSFDSLNILWDCLSLGLEWKQTFSSPVATAKFSKLAGILSAALSQHYRSGFQMAQLELYHLH